MPYVLVNEHKVERAKKELKTQGKPITEEAVRELYIKYGGLVIEEHEVSPEELKVEEVKRGRPAKK